MQRNIFKLQFLIVIYIFCRRWKVSKTTEEEIYIEKTRKKIRRRNCVSTPWEWSIPFPTLTWDEKKKKRRRKTNRRSQQIHLSLSWLFLPLRERLTLFSLRLFYYLLPLPPPKSGFLCSSPPANCMHIWTKNKITTNHHLDIFCIYSQILRYYGDDKSG